MPVKSDQYKHVCVMTVVGDVAGENAQAIRTTVDNAIEHKQTTDFIIDMEKSSFIDSEGLETLLWIRRKCEELFGQVKLANLDENCRKILEITRLDHRFDCSSDLPTALKTMR